MLHQGSALAWVLRSVIYESADETTPVHDLDQWAELLRLVCSCPGSYCRCDLGMAAACFEHAGDSCEPDDRSASIHDGCEALWEWIIENGGRTAEEEMAQVVTYDSFLRELGLKAGDDTFPDWR